MQFINCTTRRLLFHEPYESYESYGSWTCIYTPSPLVISSPQTVRLVSHCLTTRTSRTGRGLTYTPQVSLMICTPTTVRLVDHCFTTRTSRTKRTGRAKRNMPLYGSYQFVYIGQPSDVGQVFFFCAFMDRDKVDINKHAKKEWGQHPAILTQQPWSIKDLLYGFCFVFWEIWLAGHSV